MTALILAGVLGCTPEPEPPVVEPVEEEEPRPEPWSGTLPAGGDKPDILLISIDSLRADHVGSYGYHRDTTPNLDALAATGVRFANARSTTAWTLPAHSSMLTGLRPIDHGVVDGDSTLAGYRMVQHALGEVGYKTAGFTTAMYVSPQFGFAEGFDHFDNYGMTTKEASLKGHDAELVVDDVLRWFEQRDGESTFVFMHLFDVHVPYEAPNGLDAHFDRPGKKGESYYATYNWYVNNPMTDEEYAHQMAQYDEELFYVDQQLGRLFEALAARNVIIVVTADHGEEFNDHGSWGHAHTLYPEQLNVPLLVSGVGTPGVIDAMVSTHDLAATLAELGGATDMPGFSLVPALNGTEPPPRVLICDTSAAKNNKMAVLDGDDTLYWDLRYDTVETSNPERQAEWQQMLVEALGTPWHSESPVDIQFGVAVMGTTLGEQGQGDFAVSPVNAKVGEWSRTNPPPTGAPVRFTGQAAQSVNLTDEQIEALEALGYVDE